jgi:hypothetical protein
VGAVDDGALDEARIESMRHLEQELEHERRKADPQARAEAGRQRRTQARGQRRNKQERGKQRDRDQ